MSLPAAAERATLLKLLADLQRAVEDLLLTGLAAASEATRQTLAVSFEAASRMRLLRLGFTLRVATEELGRFAKNDPAFSRRRFSFFLNRAWMLSRGMRGALERSEPARWQQLAGQASSRPVAAVDVVSLGVGKRVVPGAFAAFEFRLRALAASDGIPAGAALVWSTVFPLRPSNDVPAEAFLHLPQAQGFKAAAFLPGRVNRITAATLSDDGRLSLTKESKVESSPAAFDDWDRFLVWDPKRALDRVRSHVPGPFDLEVELQEEVVLRDFQAGEAEKIERERQERVPVTSGGLTYHVLVGSGPEDAILREALAGWKTPEAGPLFGVMHYEMCRFMLQPLTLLTADGPEALLLSKDSFDAAALVKALKFT
jgi:hypothetical protein